MDNIRFCLCPIHEINTFILKINRFVCKFPCFRIDEYNTILNKLLKYLIWKFFCNQIQNLFLYDPMPMVTLVIFSIFVSPSLHRPQQLWPIFLPSHTLSSSGL